MSMFADKMGLLAQTDPNARATMAAYNSIAPQYLSGYYGSPGQDLSPELLQYLNSGGQLAPGGGNGVLVPDTSGRGIGYTYYGPGNQSYDYDQAGKFLRQYSSHDNGPGDFARYMAVVATLGAGAAAAAGAGAAGGGAGAAGAAGGATTGAVGGTTGALTGTELGTLGAASAPVVGSTGALTGTELGALGATEGGMGAAGAAGMAGAAGGGGAAGTTAGMAGVGSSVIPEGVAFTPATASQMTAMGAGSGGGFMSNLGSAASSMFSGGGSSGAPSWLGPATSIAGGLLGAQGSKNSATSSRELPGYLQGPVTDLVGRTQGLLDNQMAPAYAAGSQMVDKGSGLLAAPVAGNGVGQVKLNAPNTPTNPYLGGLADDIQRRTQEMLGQNNLAIQGNSVAAGGLGGSRQGVAQGVAAGKAADYLQGNLANLYGTAYNQDQTRALQQYGLDQGFYTGQRGQDLAQAGVGSGLMGQGFQTQFQPVTQASQVYSPFSGMGTTTTTQQQGGGAQGALGGMLGAAQFGKNMGWWG